LLLLFGVWGCCEIVDLDDLGEKYLTNEMRDKCFGAFSLVGFFWVWERSGISGRGGFWEKELLRDFGDDLVWTYFGTDW